jgi:hypothetical protein
MAMIIISNYAMLRVAELTSDILLQDLARLVNGVK